MAFIAYCHTHRHLSVNTIRLYLAGIQHHRMLSDPSAKSIFSNQAIKATLRGIQKASTVVQVRRQPVSGELFRRLSVALDGLPFGQLASIITKAAMYLGFYGFLRPGEFTCGTVNRATLLRRHLTWHADHFILSIPSAKTNQAGPPTEVEFFPMANCWCPIKVLQELLASLQSSALDAPLLPVNGRPLSSAQFVSNIRTLAAGLGYNPSTISGRSFRIGAVSAASSHQVPAHVIRRMGRWRSSCYARYIPNPRVEISRAFRSLAL
ncbi:uncharacterized protein LOC120991410 [Bufo bufo]|uniref:uncharacterized protein LOC120991410 n=1 Tax=Bufo bufo TaxID=8384 RepID=UPI001ABDEF2A|nr:uncharacterized protein LOC120991410 [Bufo bufo]